MKKIDLTLFIRNNMRHLTAAMLCGLYLLLSANATAQTDITNSFTDLAFRDSVYKKIGKVAPASIVDTDVNSITSLDISNSNISNLAGIGNFIALQYLTCTNTQITSLDVTMLSQLWSLDCWNSQLTALDVSGLTQLTVLRCSGNQLNSLNLTGCTSLTDLNCSNNQLATLNVSGLSNLTVLRCDDNQLATLNLSGLSALKDLYCYNNQLTTLNLSGLSNLEYLYCDGNQLTALVLSGLTALKYLSCSDNQLTALNVSGLSNLTDLRCYNNQLTTLNLSGLSALNNLSCSDNQLTTLNLSGLSALNILFCPNNKLTSLDLSGLSNLGDLSCYNNQLTALNVSGLTQLTVLSCFGNQLNSLTLTGCTSLTGLNCSNNQLATLNVTGLNSLQTFDCSRNLLSTLGTLSGLTQLTHLYCGVNKLTSLNVAGLTQLNELVCHNNLLTTLDVTGGLTLLQTLACENNQLTSLDVSSTGLTASSTVNCSNNNMTSTADVTGWIGGTNWTFSPQNAVSSLTVSASSMSFVDAGEAKTVNITSNVNWTASCNAAWLTVSPASGSNNGMLTVTAAANTTLLTRKDTVAVTDGSITQKIAVTQAAATPTPTLTVSASSLSFVDAGEAKTVNITSNVNWTASCNAAWLAVSPVSGSNNGTLTVTAAANTTLLTRKDTVAVTDGSITQKIAVTQAAATGTDITADFTDPNFTALVYAMIGKSAPTPILDTDVSLISGLSLRDKNISSLAGIKHFAALQELDCRDNQLTALNVSGLTQLYKIDCSNNQIASLNLSGLTNLRSLICLNNQLTSLDVSTTGLTAAHRVDCSFNKMNTTADVTSWLGGTDWTFNPQNATPALDIYIDRDNDGVITAADAPAIDGNYASPLHFNAYQDTLSFYVVSNASWTPTYFYGWINGAFPDGNISTWSGTGNAKINFTIRQTHSNASGIITINVEGGGIARSISFTKSCLTVDASTVNFAAAGSSQNVTVESNVSWTASSNAAWLTVSPSSGGVNGTNGDDNLALTAAANSTFASRTATVEILTGGIVTRRIAVTQAAATPTLTLSASSLSFIAAGEAKTVNVTANVSWTASSSDLWLTVTPASGSNNGTLTLTAAANAATQSRTATVTVTDGSITQTVAVTQAANVVVPPSLSVSASSLSFVDAGEAKTVNVTANVSWTASSSDSWLTVSPSSGSNNGTLTVTAAANAATQSRTATVTVTDGSITQTVAVTQAANAVIPPSLSVSASSLSFVDAGGAKTVNITSNVSWTASSSDSWLTVTPASGSNNGTLTVTAAANTVKQSRTATVTVTDGSNLTRTVSVSQDSYTSPELNVSRASITIPAGDSTFTVNVSSNLAWTAVSNASWLNVAPSSGNGNGTLVVKAIANTGYARTDTVFVSAGNITRRVIVTQDAAQQIIAEPTNPTVNNPQGRIEVALEIPVSKDFTITFTIKLPEGFILDQNATSLVSELLSRYRLAITATADGGWLFSITPALSTRAASETNWSKVVNIIYTVPETVKYGQKYEVKLNDVEMTVAGATVHQDEITVPVTIGTPSATETVVSSAVSFYNGVLTVETPVAERIEVYSINGAAVFTARKPEGRETYNLSALPEGVYIVKGESGWVKKILKE